MKKFTTAQRLAQLMESRNLRQVDILTKAKPYCEKYGVKLEKNALSQYVSGKQNPRQDKLTILGLALNVSEAWLMGFDVPIEREGAPVAGSEERTDEYVYLYNLLSMEKKALVIQVIRGLLTD